MKSKEDYVSMQKNQYNKYTTEDEFKKDVVGNFDYQQKYDYERWMLNENGDVTHPFFKDTKNLVALDFGCGMGRMVERMNRYFSRTDGVDIGTHLIDYCKDHYPDSNFWETDGLSCGEAFENYYDYVFSTICMQHIPSHDIRMEIWKSISKTLNIGGKFCFQMIGFVDEVKVETYIDFYKSRHGFVPMYARWRENHFDAVVTNSGHDVYILREDYSTIVEDANKIFNNCKIYEDTTGSYFIKIFISGDK